jgi:uncharacterized protein YaiL (DUF2058 family)
MSMSLRDQLLAAGLGNKNQAKQARDDQHRQRHRNQHQQGKGRAAEPGRPPGGRPFAPVQNVDPAKLARDKALEQKKRDKAERKERAAQVRQIAEPHALPRLETDDFYNFVHEGRIARVGVDAARRAALIDGSLAIVRSHGQYLVVPAEIAARVREREPRAIVHHVSGPVPAGGGDAAAAPDADDPYAKFTVPDDLVW